MLSRIPFDSLTLAAVLHEVRAFVGGRVQRIWQPDERSLLIELYAGRVAYLWIGWDPDFPRLYLSPRKPASMGSAPALCMAVRAAIEGKGLTGIEQPDRDRVVALTFEDHLLVFEGLGRAANLVVVGPNGLVKASARTVRGARSIVPGQAYVRPTTRDEASPFLRRLGISPDDVDQVHTKGAHAPVFSPGYGAYPVSVAALGYPEVPRDSISVALSNYYDVAIPKAQLDQRRRRLRSQLERVLLAREVAIQDLAQAIVEQGKADERQRMGEIILAYQHQIAPQASTLEAWDYEGNPVTIPLDPELDPVANAQVHFDRAKRAKARRDWVLQQHERHISERNDLLAMLETLETADANALEASESEAERRRWLFLQKAPVAAEERPYGGRRIRELLGPSGWTILLGENAEANDYLTLRVAKPDDWWLHVRGAVSAHAVVPTRRQPYRVPRQVLEFAALMVARNSGQKHASYVPVDYTLKRYVRKVRGAPPGTVLYTHEKTLFVDPVKSN